MDWSKTKTIFIVTFLLLNSFLVYQLIQKQNASELNVRAEMTLQQRFEDNNIRITENLPDEINEGRHIVGKRTPVPQEAIDAVDEEEILFPDEHAMGVVLDEPYSISNDNVNEDIGSFLESEIYNGEQYRFASWDQENQNLVFYQTYQGSTVYTDQEEQLVLFLNDEGDVTSYLQSFLEVEEHGRKRELLSPLKAIESLLNEQLLTFNSVVSQVELGYYSYFSPLGESQVFAPMYRIEIDEESFYLVNAIDGGIQELTDSATRRMKILVKSPGKMKRNKRSEYNVFKVQCTSKREYR
ncbi:two-component system regulatory protein YycI [Thalassobacillus sp. C254]|uniref:two-component system regulatory protein YycI n=1 Tax=Thalassobacillus sp. C254 TaxID=1225341 RepID=UPI0006D24236|nr:two-component system regulatory protein YycI [Thalassobacillus sp. C254]